MYTTPDTLIDEINRVLKEQGDRGNDIKSIEMDEAALKFFTRYWRKHSSFPDSSDPELNHQSFRIGDLVGSYRGVKVFCGVEGSVFFYNSLGHDVARLVLKGFYDMDLNVVFGKLKDVLCLGSDADELDVLIEVVRLVEDKPAPVNINWPTTIGDPIPAPTVEPWRIPTPPTITYNTEEIYDARN